MEPKRCPNCTIAITRLRRVSLSENQDILHLIRKWHPYRTITDTDIICRECWDVIKNTVDVESLDKPVLGHLDCCIMCGRSLIIRHKKLRSHQISLDNEKEALLYKVISKWKLPGDMGPSVKVCRACWQRANRIKRKQEQKDEEMQEPDSTNDTMTVMQEPDSTNDTITENPETIGVIKKIKRKTIKNCSEKTIILPNYKRSVAEDKCVFKSCKETSLLDIPIGVRKNLLVKYSYYLLPKCQICKKHLDEDNWENVVNTGVKIFTAEHIEDMIEVLKSDFSHD